MRPTVVLSHGGRQGTSGRGRHGHQRGQSQVSTEWFTLHQSVLKSNAIWIYWKLNALQMDICCLINLWLFIWREILATCMCICSQYWNNRTKEKSLKKNYFWTNFCSMLPAYLGENVNNDKILLIMVTFQFILLCLALVFLNTLEKTQTKITAVLEEESENFWRGKSENPD